MDDRPAYIPISEATLKALTHLEPEQVADVMAILYRYAFEGEEPEGDGPAAAVFELIRPGIDKAFENLRKKREAGRKRHGGTACYSKPEQTPAHPSTSQQTPADDSGTEQTREVKEEVEVKTPSPKRGEGGSRGAVAPQPRPRFVPPTLQEVADYGAEFCRERGIPPGSFDAERFHDHFASNGWRVSGRAPMKDWKASVRNWIKRDNPNAKGGDQSDLFSAYA